MLTAPGRRALEPLFLLLAAGCCIGAMFPLGKIAAAQGIPTLVYVGAAAAGASVVLALLATLAGASLRPNRETLAYAAIAGQITFAAPWSIVVAVIPHLGSAVPAIAQCLTPIATVGLVYVAGLGRPSGKRLAGLALGVAGALVLLSVRHPAADGSASLWWYFLALLVPVLLASGNVYRTVRWPSDVAPLVLAAWSMAAASLGLWSVVAAYLLVFSVPIIWAPDTADTGLIALQMVATGLGYACMFQLQRVADPVYVSQLSYLNTAVGVIFVVLLFAEPLSIWIWVALALTAFGVLLVNSGAKSRLPKTLPND